MPGFPPTRRSSVCSWTTLRGSMSSGASFPTAIPCTTSWWHPSPGSRAGSSATSGGSMSPGSARGSPGIGATPRWPRSSTGSAAVTGCGSTAWRWRTTGTSETAWRSTVTESSGGSTTRSSACSRSALAARGCVKPLGRRDLDDDTAGAIDLSPASGDLLVMGGRCQAGWLHAVPKVRGRVRSRVSAQWRWTSRRGERDRNPSYFAPRHFSR